MGFGQQVNQHQNMDQKVNENGGGKGGKRHPIKNKQGLFVTTRDGACPTLSPQGRANVCQRCLQPDRNNSEARWAALWSYFAKEEEDQVVDVPEPQIMEGILEAVEITPKGKC